MGVGKALNFHHEFLRQVRTSGSLKKSIGGESYLYCPNNALDPDIKLHFYAGNDGLQRVAANCINIRQSCLQRINCSNHWQVGHHQTK